MSYTPAPYQGQGSSYATPNPMTQPTHYSATPPPPPPKPSSSSTPANRGPPLPPPPPQAQNGPSELDASQGHRYQQQQGQQQPHIPRIEQGWLPESLKEKSARKSTSDLHDLLQDPELQNALLTNPETTHPSIPASQSHLQPLLNTNLQLSNTLSDLEKRLTARRSALQSRLLALRALEQSHRSKISETEDALKSFSPMALYQRLNGSVQEQQNLLKGLEESWLEEGGRAGEREVGDFVRRVKEAEKVEFLRRERKGRWDEGRVGGWR
ncbi:hypothetical protein MBLNU230_g1052t1 [Neophaeotheca triangularis]